MAAPVLEIEQGRIEGELVAGGRVARFLGIPYAGDISGADRRFLPAGPAASWTGLQACTAFGPAAPQPVIDFGPSPRSRAITSLVEDFDTIVHQDENCLVLNVWAPAGSPQQRRPVMCWIHGGAHTVGSGASPVCDGTFLAAQHDVVVVTLNHRLGVLGYLHLDDVLGPRYAGSGNVGNLDLVQALQWVKANVGAFGGDGSNVTVFGVSGGGAKIAALMAMPDASGLFHRAIIQSGPQLSAISRDDSDQTARALLAELGLGVEEATKLLDIPSSDLINAQLRLLGSPLGSITGGPTLGPVIDGVVLTHDLFEPTAPQESASVPLLIGTTKDETKLFTYPNESLDTLDEERAEALLRKLHGDRGSVLHEAYRTSRPVDSCPERFSAALSDRLRVGSIRMAERKAALPAGGAWMYRFDFETDVLDGALGAPHGIEVAYVFGTPDATVLTGRRAGRQELADRVSAAWAAFARYGEPRSDLLPHWPPYDSQRRATMIFDAHCEVIDDPDGAERRAWEGIRAGL